MNERHRAFHSYRDFLITNEAMIQTDKILENLGYESLTPMQCDMNQAALNNEGVVLLSPTGSGKTWAYMQPLLQLISPELDALQAVVIVPTRELAMQSEDLLKRTKCGIRSMALFGGRPTMQEHRVLREVKPQVVFATPGRLNDHLQKENVNAHGVKVVVVDEFDKCLELGFQKEMESVISQFDGTRHCWLTSATDSDEIPGFMNRRTKSYRKLDYLNETGALKERVAVYQVPSPEKDKLETLGRLLSHIKGQQAIVFVAHRESVDRVGKWLAGERFDVGTYHGGMEQDLRERALYRFRSGAANVLVSTDLAARGLDIPEVRAVIHYHLPGKAEEYTHRNGRTARWEADGAVYLIIGPTETLPDYADEADTLNVDAEPIAPHQPEYASLYIGRGKRDKLSKGDILGFFCKKGGLTAGDIGRIDVAAHHAYVAVKRSKLKSLLKMIGGEKIKGMKTLIEETKRW